MRITKRWLEKQSACKDGIEWFCRQDETDGVKVVLKLMEDNRFNWANWLIVRLKGAFITPLIEQTVTEVREWVEELEKENEALQSQLDRVNVENIEKLIPEVYCDVYPPTKEVFCYARNVDGKKCMKYLLQQERGKDLASEIVKFVKGESDENN